MVSLLLIFDITVAKSCVYGKQALHDEGRMYEEFFVNPYVGWNMREYTEYISYELADLQSLEKNKDG